MGYLFLNTAKGVHIRPFRNVKARSCIDMAQLKKFIETIYGCKLLQKKRRTSPLQSLPVDELNMKAKMCTINEESFHKNSRSKSAEGLPSPPNQIEMMFAISKGN